MTEPASTLQLCGAFAFGALIGWYVYYINRYRRDAIQLSDLASVIGVIGGGGVLTLFPAKSDLFGAYGVGLGIGFFGYFLILAALVSASKNFTVDWFLDGRRIPPATGQAGPQGTDGHPEQRPMLDLHKGK